MAQSLPVRTAGLPLQMAMLACFSLMGIYWVRFVQLGGFSLEAYHVGLLCMVMVTVVSVYTPAAMYRVLLRTMPWFLAYVVYLLFLVPALSGTSATGLLMKQGLFVTGFLCIATYFSRVEDPARSLRLGGIAGLVLYLAFTEFAAFVIGKSMVGAVAEFITTGSYKALIYGFFRPVFNSLESGADLAFVASLTNSIAV